ncbi:hypothetical protein PSTT_00384, partial [Puccinia striiformis]
RPHSFYSADCLNLSQQDVVEPTAKFTLLALVIQISIISDHFPKPLVILVMDGRLPHASTFPASGTLTKIPSNLPGNFGQRSQHPLCYEFTGVAETLKIDFLRSQTDDHKLSGATNTPLLDQARKLGDKLLAGSLVMEFDWLSFHTRQPEYLQYATKAAQTVIKTPSALPGLPGLIFGVKNQTILNDLATWGSKMSAFSQMCGLAGTDSYLEYLLKFGMLIGNSGPSYYTTWKQAVQSSIKKLIQVLPVRKLTYLGDFSASCNVIDLEFPHLACYVSGNWILGRKVFQDRQTFDYGLRLLTTCKETYKQTATGLGPEIFRFLGPNSENSGDKPSPQDVEPEGIKSAFYAWRLTGDAQYQEFFGKLLSLYRSNVKLSSVTLISKNVNSNLNPQPKDASKSFFTSVPLSAIIIHNSTLASTKDLKTGSKLGAGSAITPRSLLKLLMLCSF